jgi:hypothetical protein
MTGTAPRACFACSRTPAAGAVLPARKREGRPLLCADCQRHPHLAERLRQRRREMALHPGSRQSRRGYYRAPWRHSAAAGAPP